MATRVPVTPTTDASGNHENQHTPAAATIRKKLRHAPLRTPRVWRDDDNIRDIKVVADVLDGGGFRVQLWAEEDATRKSSGVCVLARVCEGERERDAVEMKEGA